MEKSKVIQTLRDMQEIAKSLEKICDVQGHDWDANCKLSVGDLDLDNPGQTLIRLYWDVYGWGNSPPEERWVDVPLELLWESDAVLQPQKEYDEELWQKRHQSKLIEKVIPGRRFRYTRYNDYLCESIIESWDGVVISVDSGSIPDLKCGSETVMTVRLDTREKVTFYNCSFLCPRNLLDEVIILPVRIIDVSSLV
jgi:hypothetical protein